MSNSATVKYPDIRVKLVGEDGNAFAILARVRRALRKARVPTVEIEAFTADATSGDYNNLLRVCMGTVKVD